MDTKHNNITQVGDANFSEEVLKSDIPVFVDFYATWCGPCKYFANVMNEVAPLYDGKVKFVKVNVDDSPGIASRAGIFSVPTLMFVKGGKVEKAMSGALDKNSFVRELDRFIA